MSAPEKSAASERNVHPRSNQYDFFPVNPIAELPNRPAVDDVFSREKEIKKFEQNRGRLACK